MIENAIFTNNLYFKFNYNIYIINLILSFFFKKILNKFHYSEISLYLYFKI